MPIFGKSKGLVETVRVAAEQLSGSPQDIKRELAGDLPNNLRIIKTQITAPDFDEPSGFWPEMYKCDLLYKMVIHMKELDFEPKKDARLIFVQALQRKAGSKHPTADYIARKAEVLSVLCSLYESQCDGLNSGPMLRECINHPELAQIFLNSSSFFNLFEYTECPTFDLASDAFATLRHSLTRHKQLASEFLQNNYQIFFQRYERMIASENYATRRQYLKLLSDLLLDRCNFEVMGKYICNPHYLKTLMMLLKDKSPSIQFEAFHVFKILVANPRKPDNILDILTRNKAKLIKLLENFLPDRSSDEQFNEEKEYLLNQIREL